YAALNAVSLISAQPSNTPGQSGAMFSIRSWNRFPPLSRTPVIGPPPPVLSFHVPDSEDSPRTSESESSPSPRLSRYRPPHTRAPVIAEDARGVTSAVELSVSGAAGGRVLLAR